MFKNTKRKILELVHRASYEVMRRAQIELSIMDLREMPPVSQEEVAEELERMDGEIEAGGWAGCGLCPTCRARREANALLN